MLYSTGVHLCSITWKTETPFTVSLQTQERHLVINRAINLARRAASSWDQDEPQAPLLCRRCRMAGTAVLHCILEDYVPLLVNAVEQPKEVAAIVYTDQHSPEQQLPEFGNSW